MLPESRTTLGVNIDHVATLRQARKINQPDPVWAAALAQLGGADCITIHLREDRRHIQDRDLEILKQTVTVKLNLECACEPSMLAIAVRVRPDQVCLVPERREEITTEGGLDVVANQAVVRKSVEQLQSAGIRVSIFIDPQLQQINAAASAGADIIEIHTGAYCHQTGENRDKELTKISLAAEHAHRARLEVHAGHGLNYENVIPVAAIPQISELNIGHSIIGRSVFVGIQQAVREMKELLLSAKALAAKRP